MPYGLAMIVILAWGVTVSWPVENIIESSDRLGCIGPHLTQFLALMALGMATGVGFGPTIHHWADRGMEFVFPKKSEAERARILRLAGIVIIVVSMIFVFPWTSAQVDQFVVLHQTLTAETDLVVYVMGGFAGVAWHILWNKYAWFGIALSILMSLMMLANTLSRHAWC